MCGDKSQFTLIARHYDALMASVPYRQWVAYIEAILERLNYRPLTVLDLACGTGNVSELLAQRGYKVVGVDISPAMVEVARSKGGQVDYIVQDIADLDLGKQFELAVCLFDSLNYITDPERAAQALKRIAEHLVPGGVLIFDVNTVYALQHKFFDQANLSPASNPRYVWTSEYDHQTRLCRIEMLFEVLDEDGEVHQFKEIHYQRGHTLEELTQWLIDAGFYVVDTFHAYRLRKPTRRSDRVFFVAKRKTE